MSNSLRILVLSSLALLRAAPLRAQNTTPSQATAHVTTVAPVAPATLPNPFMLSPEERRRLQKLTDEDHDDMMGQLGIKALRPGPNGSTAPGTPNPANYDPAKANPFPDWPDALTLKNGEKVTTAAMWWQQRRPEIVEDFEREVIGRVPANVPKVTWEVTETVNTTVGGLPVVARRVIGHVDNSAVHCNHRGHQDGGGHARERQGPVPVLMMFGWGNMPGEPVPRFPATAGALRAAVHRSADRRRLGLRFDSTRPASRRTTAPVSPQGIIGLTNKGQRRKPDDWGALRAWAWGAARALDYLETAAGG